MQQGAAQDGLKAHGSRWHMGELAKELVRLAGEGLDRIGHAGGNEASYLKPLEGFVEQGMTLADSLIARHGAGPWEPTALSEMVLAHTL